MLLVFMFLSLFMAPKDSIKTSDELVKAMHDRYAKTWYKTLTFVQKTTNYEADGTTKVETWYEAMAVPGKLRIDFDPISEGSGLLFVNDSIYPFEKGEAKPARPRIHPLLVLGFDVYMQPVQETIDKLKKLGFDLSILREDTWQGRPVYVVGAKAGDLKSSQFWIDKERLYFVRMIQPAGQDKSHTQETQFNKYEKVGGGWVSPEVIFMLDGKVRTTEEYTEMKGDVALDPKLFDPASFRTVHWR